MSKDKIEVNMNVYDIPILVEALEEANKEIERLNNKVEELMTLYTTERNVKEDYKSIIKEVREYIENYPTLRYSSMDNSNGNRLTGKLVPTDKILEILDKVEE